jgi:hypothetical protein
MKKIPFIVILVVLFLMFFITPVALIMLAATQAPHAIVEDTVVNDHQT